MHWRRRPAYDPDQDDGVVAETLRRLQAAELMSLVRGVSEEPHDGIGTEYVAVDYVKDLLPEQVARIARALDGLDYELRRVQAGHGVFYSHPPSGTGWWARRRDARLRREIVRRHQREI